MKKTLIIMTAAMLFLSLPLSGLCAEDGAKQATVFDIPWFSSTDEVLRRLIDKGFIDSAESVFVMDKTGVDSILDEQARITGVDSYSTVMSAILLVNRFEISEVKMAGYVVDMLVFDFAYDGTKTELIGVNVSLQAPDGYNVSDDVLPDILKKLERLYGSGKETGDEYLRSYAFIGAERTAVCVQYSHWATSTLKLVYGTLDAMPLLENNLDRQRNQQGGVNPDDLTGL